MANEKWRPDIEQLVSLGNFSQLFRWRVEIPKIPRVLASQYNANQLSDGINFRAESMTIPEANVESTEIQIRGHKLHQAGIVTYNSPITLTMPETIDHWVLDFVGRWQYASWEATESRGRTAYKLDLCGEVNLYLLDNTDRPYYLFQLHYCQPENVAKGDVDAGTGDPLKPQLSLAYDYFTKHSMSHGEGTRPRSKIDGYNNDSIFTGSIPRSYD